VRLSDYKKDFHDFSAKASDVARSAAFAGIALVWVFRLDSKPVLNLPRGLLAPVALFALGLALDLLHYVTAAAIWGGFHFFHERQLRNPQTDPLLSHSFWLPLPLYVLFTLKLVAVVSGYVFVVAYLWQQWFPGAR